MGLVDGVLLMEVLLDDERVRFLRDDGVPFALIGRTADVERTVYADNDFAEAGALAVDYLVGLGHEDIAFVYGPQRRLTTGPGAPVRAQEAVVHAASRAGVRLITVACEHSRPAGQAAFHQIVTQMPDVSAVISANDEATGGVIVGAREHGMTVPHDLSAVSISTSEAQAEASAPALTAVSPPARDIARAATAGLIAHLKEPGREPVQALFKGVLVERESSGPRPRRSHHR